MCNLSPSSCPWLHLAFCDPATWMLRPPLNPHRISFTRAGASADPSKPDIILQHQPLKATNHWHVRALPSARELESVSPLVIGLVSATQKWPLARPSLHTPSPPVASTGHRWCQQGRSLLHHANLAHAMFELVPLPPKCAGALASLPISLKGR